MRRSRRRLRLRRCARMRRFRTSEAARGASEIQIYAWKKQVLDNVASLFALRGERFGGRRGGARARDGQALRQDRPTDGRTGFLGQEAGRASARSKSDGRTAWQGPVGAPPMRQGVARSGSTDPSPSPRRTIWRCAARRTASRTSVLRFAANDLRTQQGRPGSTASGCGG